MIGPTGDRDQRLRGFLVQIAYQNGGKVFIKSHFHVTFIVKYLLTIWYAETILDAVSI